MLENTPVDAIQTGAEFWPLLDLYRARRPRRVLEVGTYKGGTLYHWLRNAPPGATVVSVDLFEDVTVDNTYLYAEWAGPGVQPVVVRGDSRDPNVVAAAAAHGPFDWAFIDAGHLEEEVRADWANYRPLAAPGSIIAFHDIQDVEHIFPRIQVHRLWAELAQEYVTREFCVPGGGGIGVVYIP